MCMSAVGGFSLFLVFFLKHQTKSCKVIPVPSTCHPPRILALHLGSSSWGRGDAASPPHTSRAAQGQEQSAPLSPCTPEPVTLHPCHLMWELRWEHSSHCTQGLPQETFSFDCTPLPCYWVLVQIEQSNFESVLMWKIFQQCPGDRTSQKEVYVCLHLVYRLSGFIFSYLHSCKGFQVQNPARKKLPSSCETVLKPLDQHHKMNVLQP